MKQLLIKFFNILGFKLVKSEYYKSLININSLRDLDCHFLIKKILNGNENICMLDIGANTGQSIYKLKKYYPDGKIYSFEPVLKTYEELLVNISGKSNINIYNYAMGAAVGEDKIYYRNNSEWNSLLPKLNESAKEEGAPCEVIQINTVDNFVKENHIERIHFLKSDTEGYELEVLKGADDCLTRQLIDTLYIEVGFNKEEFQHNYWIEIIEYLKKYEYNFSGLFEVCYGNNLTIQYANALFCSNKIIDKII